MTTATLTRSDRADVDADMAGRSALPGHITAAYVSAVGGSAHQGARMAAALGQWSAWLGDPDQTWTWDAETLAARSWDLVRNDGHCRAMLEAVLMMTLGASGLRFCSLYQADDQADTSDAEKKARRAIERSIANASTATRLDAGGQLARRNLARQFMINKIVTGDGFAVRVWAPARPGAYQGSAWRVVPFERVCNPDRQSNSDRLWEGMEYDDAGVWSAVWVRDRHPGSIGAGRPPTWTRHAVCAPDGTRNVLHGFRALAGERRGVSWFAPLLVLAKHLQQTTAAWVIAKRTQACHPLVVKTDDPKATADAQRAQAVLGPNTQLSPGRIYYTAAANDIYAPDWSFNGSDYQAFVDSQLRVFSAAWGLPFQFVMQQLTQANLASSRAALDQADRSGECFQQDLVDDFDAPINETIIREDVARGRLKLNVADGDWSRALRGRYLGPRRWSTDKLKDADAATSWIKLGVAPSTAFADQGMVYEEEVAQAAQDAAYRAAQGQPDPLAAPAPATAPTDDQPEPDDQTDESEPDDAPEPA